MKKLGLKRKGIKNTNRNKLILIILTLLVAIMIYALYRGMQANQDVKTRQFVSALSNPIDSYIQKNNTVPNNLQEIGATNIPSTVQYRKIDNKRFELCVTFRRANDPSVSRLKQFVNLVTGRPTQHAIDDAEKQEYYGTISVDDLHLAGPDCYITYYYLFWPELSFDPEM